MTEAMKWPRDAVVRLAAYPIFKSIMCLQGYQDEGETCVIKFDRLWETMKKKNVSTYQLREKCGIDSKTIRRLKANENMETKTLDKLCSALECKIEDIIEFVNE